MDAVPFFSGFASQIPSLLISLPVILLALSVHETAHGFVALKLGDPTARNLGRLTLNPLKHIDIIGFLCMLLFHFGWANPVPINTRNFKKPRRDMALTGLAGPVSNVLMAILSVLLLRLLLLIAIPLCGEDVQVVQAAYLSGEAYTVSARFVVFSILAYMLYLGMILNLSYALFNLIPIPPLDGSRIFYVFLPSKWYFGLMKYERIIAVVMLIGLWTGIITLPLNWAISGISGGLMHLTGMASGSETYRALSWMMYHINSFI